MDSPRTPWFCKYSTKKSISCEIPQGEVIVDSNGNVVEGVEGWGNDPKQCGIRIISAEKVDQDL